MVIALSYADELKRKSDIYVTATVGYFIFLVIFFMLVEFYSLYSLLNFYILVLILLSLIPAVYYFILGFSAQKVIPWYYKFSEVFSGRRDIFLSAYYTFAVAKIGDNLYFLKTSDEHLYVISFINKSLTEVSFWIRLNGGKVSTHFPSIKCKDLDTDFDFKVYVCEGEITLFDPELRKWVSGKGKYLFCKFVPSPENFVKSDSFNKLIELAKLKVML